MKKILSVFLVLALSLGLAPALGEGKTIRVGMVSVLNRTEEEMAAYCKGLWLGTEQMDREGYVQGTYFHDLVEGLPEGTLPEFEVTFYDTMESMLMALDAGHIDFMESCLYTSLYIAANHDGIIILNDVDRSKPFNYFVSTMYWGPAATEYSFLLLEEDAALRDQLSACMSTLAETGVLENLRNTYVVEMNTDPVDMPVIEGAETIRVAVTGSIPPLDYISADDRPSGFTTALLAEMSKILNKNIELVIADSTGRAASLTSGKVDAAFWVQCNAKCDDFMNNIPPEQREISLGYLLKQMSEEQAAVMKRILEYVDVVEYGTRDRPDGTINTIEYVQDFLTFVTTETQYNIVKEMLHSN